MTALTNTLASPAARAPRAVARASHGAALRHFVRMEFLKLLRMPTFVIPVLLFPILFFAMFGMRQLQDSLGGLDGGSYMLVAYGSYTVMSVAMFSFSVSVAVERSLGWHALLRASPMPAWVYFLGKSLLTAVFGMLSVAVLFAFCRFVAGIQVPAGMLLGVLGCLAIGLVPFSALGLLLGYVLGPNSVVGVANGLFLCLAFASGIFVPYPALPQLVREIALYLPSYHLARMGWNVVSQHPLADQLPHLAWLAGYSVLFFGAARLAYQRGSHKAQG
ncbi:ABC transporter permease [Ramlibacter sp.]|uniref:ABC transporter permease n=1 Tax=Ramlibacter sp. TaxID=1917967 RepID=UPI0017EFEA9B|nr:ABC transporter permease [Ramlibacter sp.]MBA2674445.1 ABC transporter permease [Ramlibacter sp.]